MRQPFCRDLRAGDLMLKVSDGSLISKTIQFGQTPAGGRNVQIVHAGMMFEGTYIIEAQKHGIEAHDLRVQNKPYGYVIFRCSNGNMAAGAGTCAKMMFDIHQRGGNLKYGLGGAVGSLFGAKGKAASPGQMDHLLDRILEGRSHPFFCSQFAVYVYQFVAEQNGMPAGRLFNLADAKVPPTTLASCLVGHALFQEVGYMMPNER